MSKNVPVSSGSTEFWYTPSTLLYSKCTHFVPIFGHGISEEAINRGKQDVLATKDQPPRMDANEHEVGALILATENRTTGAGVVVSRWYSAVEILNFLESFCFVRFCPAD
jgi:hypothetical protein